MIIAQTAPTPAEVATPTNAGSTAHLIWDKLQDALTTIVSDALIFIPKAIVAVVIGVVGWLVAKAIAKAVAASFDKSGLDNLIGKSQLGAALRGLGLRSAPGALLSKILYWMLILIFLRTAADAANLGDIKAVVGAVFGFLPKVLVATIITLIGFMVADVVRVTAMRTLTNFGVDYAKMLAGILFGFIIVLVLTAALSQLGIQTELLNASVKIILAGCATAIALALGLGMKNLANSMVAGVYARDLYKAGTQIELDGQHYEVAGVGPVTTKLIQPDGTFLIIPNARLVSENIRGKK